MVSPPRHFQAQIVPNKATIGPDGLTAKTDHLFKAIKYATRENFLPRPESVSTKQ